MCSNLSESILLKQIDLLKNKMIKLANNTGIDSHATLTCSQKLDTLLNLHMRHFSNKK
ncbi:Spo0E family sporulation regulatory protein-aspartic acid phosphatase [Bacillus salipaludis]|uniref:Spo0E family sporulation regulatory protein-aspartic acid phosphatase n=1 Tax=Bacillus salipaludis TaxID=2547811 RepID=UPI003AF32043